MKYDEEDFIMFATELMDERRAIISDLVNLKRSGQTQSGGGHRYVKENGQIFLEYD